jgi:hypothetical protein
MTNSDNGSIPEALMRWAAQPFGWPPLGALPD